MKRFAFTYPPMSDTNSGSTANASAEGRNAAIDSTGFSKPTNSHLMQAIIDWLPASGGSVIGSSQPLAQLSMKPAFMLAAEGDAGAMLSTGVAPWKTKRINGLKFIHPAMTWGSGAKLHVVGNEFDWHWETGGGDGWIEPRTVHTAFGPEHLIDQPLLWQMKAGHLPAMYEKSVHVGVARHVQALAQPFTEGIAKQESFVRATDHLETEAKHWNAMLAGAAALVIEPKTRRRVIIDLQNYYCAYTDCVTSGGSGAVIKSWWAESLYEVEPSIGYDKAQSKAIETSSRVKHSSASATRSSRTVSRIGCSARCGGKRGDTCRFWSRRPTSR